MALFGRSRKAKTSAAAEKAKAAAESAGDTLADVAAKGPSPNPMTNAIIADLALRAGDALLRRGVETAVLGAQHGKKKARAIVRGRGIGQTLVRTALVRVATRSVPGAIVVGGGLLAKTLYDRRHAARARKEGARALDDQAKDGTGE